jgi:predicted ATPase/DNA-binding SARP family transcriptional activator
MLGEGGTQVELSILGPLQVRDGDREVLLSGAKTRIVLLRLLVDPNRPVAADRIADDVWDGAPPRTAATTLQGYVSRLRKSLGTDRVHTRAGGYKVVVRPGELDATVFVARVDEGRRLLEAGEPGHAAERLTTALATWRGTPLLDAAGAAWAAGTVARLESTRLLAIEARLDAGLALGAHGDVATEAEAAIAEHPLHERLWMQLMTALALDGRQADALRAYQRLRRCLGDELGIEPSREVVELESAILRQELIPSPRIGSRPAPAARSPDGSVDDHGPRSGHVGSPHDPAQPGDADLPASLTTFIGRDDERRRVHDLLRDHRLVTITGVGGVGKTRLALQVASEAIERYRDGAVCCELAAATDEETLLTVVATSIGVPRRTGLTPEASIVERLRAQERLLILDNCEHLLQPAAVLVDQILGGCPGVSVLATSREALDVDGERVSPLRPMKVATSDSLTDVVASDAVGLFVDRATTVRPDFAVDPGNASTINDICVRLDGIPLAIELAAVRVVSMSPDEIAARIDERFRLLTGGRRIALERHRTLRAALEWSYDLLDERERTVFDRLAVFAGSFDADAAQAVITDELLTGWDVIDALDGLVRKSLLGAETQPSGTTRYQFLETLRQYALDRLAEGGDAERWRQRHADHFAERFAAINERLLGPDELVWRAQREPELDNLRAALAWSIDQGDAQLVMRLVNLSSEEALIMWNRMGRPATRVLPLLDQLQPAEKVQVLVLASFEAYMQGDLEEASALNKQAEDMAVPLPLGPASVLLSQSWGPSFAESQMHARAVEAVLARPEELDRPDLNVASRARVYSSLSSYVLQSGGDRAIASHLADRSYELALESANPSTIAMACFALTQVLARDEPERALDAIDRCIAISEGGGSGVSNGAALYVSALLFAKRGDRRLALTRLRASITCLAPRGRAPELDGAFGYAIETLALLHDDEPAAVLIGSVLAGPLANLRDLPLPPDRGLPDVRELRTRLGPDRFAQLVADGAAHSYAELIAWLVATLGDLIEGDVSSA